MNTITIPPPPKGDLVLYLPCGCIGYACADSAFDVSAALEIARCMMLGWKPGYLTTEQVRAALWGCDVCKTTRADRPQPVLVDAAENRDDPRWRVKGTVTFSITFAVDGIIVAPTADAALDALAEDPSPLFVLSDEERMEYEWDDDDLKVTQVEAGATPGQGGSPLPEGVEQLTLI